MSISDAVITILTTVFGEFAALCAQLAERDAALAVASKALEPFCAMDLARELSCDRTILTVLVARGVDGSVVLHEQDFRDASSALATISRLKKERE